VKLKALSQRERGTGDFADAAKPPGDMPDNRTGESALWRQNAAINRTDMVASRPEAGSGSGWQKR